MTPERLQEIRDIVAVDTAHASQRGEMNTWKDDAILDILAHLDAQRAYA